MDCSICLEPLDPSKGRFFVLSCDHTFHHACYQRLVKETSHSFVKCPLCRRMNTTSPQIKELSAEDNLKLWFHNGDRCQSKTKCGLRCKHKSLFLNNGCCRIHQPDILSKDKYQVYSEYVWYTLASTNFWCTKIYMLDISKKILIKHPEITQLHEIHHYLLQYFHKCYHDNLNETKKSNPRLIYKYYQLDFPDKHWIKRSIEGKLLI
jgi:hypothetical protein